jgi:predicted dehydrogenase
LQGALREELAYFLNCVATGEPASIITPEESREAVRACLAAEESAATGKVVQI